MRTNYTKRAPEEFNFWRAGLQKFVCSYIYGLYYQLAYGLKIEGKENLKDIKNIPVIVAGNHMSAIDPFLMIHAVKKPVAFMAKEELFQKPLARFFLDVLGAFAVNRSKVGASTIKTALGIKKTKWSLGLFPQGTRETNGLIEHVSKGFASMAKAAKLDILPVAIIGADKRTSWPFSAKITIRIGELIPYSDNVDEMVEKWAQAIAKLTGFELRLKLVEA